MKFKGFGRSASIAFALCIFLFSQIAAQEQTYQVQDFTISILGASTLHDWKVATNEIAEYPEAIIIDEELQVKDFGFKVPVDGMDGGRGPSMNKKIKKALKSTEHPFVIFTQTQAIAIENIDGSTMSTTGLLTIAGVEKEITIEVIASKNEGQLVFTGKYPMKMSDFDIEPPTAMFGQIVTKDDITIEFELIYQTK